MRIIVEGADGSGKTTLAKYLADAFHLDYYKSRGPVRNSDDFLMRYWEWRRAIDMVFDRHAVISEFIYGPIMQRRQPTESDVRVAAHFYRSSPCIVYCIAPLNLDKHDATSPTDTPEYLELLAKKHRHICEAYNVWSRFHPVHVYQVGMDMHAFAQRLKEGYPYAVAI